MREFKFRIYACNTDPGYCDSVRQRELGNYGDAAPAVEVGSRIFFGAMTSGDAKQGFTFHYGVPKDISAIKLTGGATGTWKQDLIVDSTVTPATKLQPKPKPATS